MPTRSAATLPMRLQSIGMHRWLTYCGAFAHLTNKNICLTSTPHCTKKCNEACFFIQTSIFVGCDTSLRTDSKKNVAFLPLVTQKLCNIPRTWTPHSHWSPQ